MNQDKNIEQVAKQTTVSIRTLYNWLNEWNEEKKALVNQSSQQSGRQLTLTNDQRIAFAEYLHGLPEAHFTRSELAQFLFQQTGVRYSDHYLPQILGQVGLRYYKPRPSSVRRPAQAKASLTERVRATFNGLQALGYDLERPVRFLWFKQARVYKFCYIFRPA